MTTIYSDSLIALCRSIVCKAEADLGPLPKASYLDLVADNVPNVPLATLRDALKHAGVGYVVALSAFEATFPTHSA